ncbi:winged helix family two component transcriptional regulator [Stenotrophomonas rhizophila]|uniref:DNA-binding response OmpR family regulator n=1 Tax=Stenotrophomonas rhizophila TaxID=216778 RepID=A0AAW5PLK4_9GAMM|nr:MULTISPECIES: response regulator transcription factor [Stenotrophomonas]MCS4280846.1 DNA-binding response OmpR family regulator [Stenotrophomonas rhizophila]MCW6027403.1 response regulator transcription factor [Stenotrophomonas sp. SRS1]ROP77182.1 winged helix family two component transcriptional regulator [Stenotrophomonas rhizophila]
MRLLLLEDDPEMASAIQVSLARHGMVVDVVGTMAQADEALKAGVHQILLLDRQLPDGDGASFVKVAREHVPNLPVIMLTARASVADRVTGLDVGADDYLTKPFAVEELLARIRAISRRPSQIALPLLSLGRLQFDFVAREARVSEVLLALPRRQLLVLEALALRQGRTVGRASLLEAVYGFDDAIQSNALDAHVSKLRKALLEADAGVEIHVMRGIGYLLKDAP